MTNSERRKLFIEALEADAKVEPKENFVGSEYFFERLFALSEEDMNHANDLEKNIVHSGQFTNPHTAVAEILKQDWGLK